MKRIVLGLFISLFAVISWCPVVQAYSSPTVYLDGSQLYFDVPAQIINGRAVVPMRAIFEALDADVSWNGASQTVRSTKGSITMTMKIGSNVYSLNGVDKITDVPAQIINGRTMVPLRVVAESLQCKVEYKGNINSVMIESGPGNSSVPSITEGINHNNSLPTDDFEFVNTNMTCEINMSASVDERYHYFGNVTVKNTGNTKWNEDYSYEYLSEDSTGLGWEINEKVVCPGEIYTTDEYGSWQANKGLLYLVIYNRGSQFGEQLQIPVTYKYI
ncbi:MAG: copper amine oxidase N-terminal domain-containing protein [Methanobacterium sp.]